MKDRLRKFMMGRYGIDSFGRFLLVLACITLLLSRMFFRNALYIVSLMILIYAYYRVFSKKINKRYKENNTYLNYKYKIRNFILKEKYMFKQRRIYHIYRCPGCRQKIRIPKGKGKVCITCPKCKTEFIKRS